MKKTDIKKLKTKMSAADLSYRNVYEALGISRGWFMRMIKGDFHEPNPEWMARIHSYVDDTIALRANYK